MRAQTRTWKSYVETLWSPQQPERAKGKPLSRGEKQRNVIVLEDCRSSPTRVDEGVYTSIKWKKIKNNNVRKTKGTYSNTTPAEGLKKDGREQGGTRDKQSKRTENGTKEGRSGPRKEPNNEAKWNGSGNQKRKLRMLVASTKEVGGKKPQKKKGRGRKKNHKKVNEKNPYSHLPFTYQDVWHGGMEQTCHDDNSYLF